MKLLDIVYYKWKSIRGKFVSQFGKNYAIAKQTYVLYNKPKRRRT